MLRWEKQKDRQSFWAYSGRLVVGMVGERDNGDWWYSFHGIPMKATAKTDGDVKSLASAKRAISDGWCLWLDNAELQPK